MNWESDRLRPEQVTNFPCICKTDTILSVGRTSLVLRNTHIKAEINYSPFYAEEMQQNNKEH
jgi:hypothetical protein